MNYSVYNIEENIFDLTYYNLYWVSVSSFIARNPVMGSGNVNKTETVY